MKVSSPNDDAPIERRASIAALRIAGRLRALFWRATGVRVVGVRGLVVDDHGQVLLVRHTYGAGAWHLPGGGVKRRESLSRAVVRELREETGIVVDEPLSQLGTFSNLADGKSDHITVFEVRSWRQGADPPSAEIAERRFFPPSSLPPTIAPGSRRRIEEWSTGTTPPGPDPFGW